MQVLSNGRVRRTAAEWQSILDRYARSGLSAAAFCEQEGLSTASLLRWRARVSATPSGFVTLDPPSSPSPSSSASAGWLVELELPGQIVLRVRG
jgi:hypothetical protein